MNTAMGKLSAEDNLFVSSGVVNPFYAALAVPGTDEAQIGASNPSNAALNAVLPAVEADAANLANISNKFNSLVMDVSAFATYVLNNVAGSVF